MSLNGMGQTISVGNCNGNNEQTLTANGSGTMPYTYLWSNGETNQSIAAVATNNYSVTVTDNDGITVTASYNALTITTWVAIPIKCNPLNYTYPAGSTTGVLAANGVGGDSGPGHHYQYLWSNGCTSNANSGLTGGTFGVTFTDDKGCAVSSTATLPTVAYTPVSSSKLTQTNTSISLRNIGGAGATYKSRYSLDGNAWTSWSTINPIQNLSPNTCYYVQVEDRYLCVTAPIRMSTTGGVCP